jgi:hypothetical protein
MIQWVTRQSVTHGAFKMEVALNRNGNGVRFTYHNINYFLYVWADNLVEVYDEDWVLARFERRLFVQEAFK